VVNRLLSLLREALHDFISEIKYFSGAQEKRNTIHGFA
jgi:hypothetical protein